VDEVPDRINYDGSGDPWVWMRPEICDRCKKKCTWYGWHYHEHKQKHYEMNQVRLYLRNKVRITHPDKDIIGCPFITEHVLAQDGSQPQVDDRRPLNDRCRMIK